MAAARPGPAGGVALIGRADLQGPDALLGVAQDDGEAPGPVGDEAQRGGQARLGEPRDAQRVDARLVGPVAHDLELDDAPVAGADDAVGGQAAAHDVRAGSAAAASSSVREGATARSSRGQRGEEGRQEQEDGGGEQDATGGKPPLWRSRPVAPAAASVEHPSRD